MYKHTGQGSVGYFWNGLLVDVCVQLLVQIMNYVNFNVYEITMAIAFVIAEDT